MSDFNPADLDIDLDDILSADSEVTETSAVFDPGKPYWAISREELLRAMNIALSFPSKSTVVFAIVKRGNKLLAYSNNKDAELITSLPLLNEDAHETDKEYFLDVNLLKTLVMSYAKFVLSFDENGGIYYQSPYSNVKLDTINMTIDDVRLEDTEFDESACKYEQFPLSKGEIRVFKSLFGFAPKMTDNKVIFRDKNVDAFFTLYLHQIQLNRVFKDPFILRNIDIPSLVEASVSEVEYCLTSTRAYFKFDLGTLSFTRLPYNAEDFQFPLSFADGDQTGEVMFDINLFKRALRLTSALKISTVDYVQRDDQIFQLAGQNAEFLVGSGYLNEQFTLTTELLTKLVANIDPSEITLKAKITATGMDLNIQKDDRTLVYSLSKTTTGQLKRAEKTEGKGERREAHKEVLKEKGKFTENFVPEEGQSLGEALNNL